MGIQKLLHRTIEIFQFCGQCAELPEQKKRKQIIKNQKSKMAKNLAFTKTI